MQRTSGTDPTSHGRGADATSHGRGADATPHGRITNPTFHSRATAWLTPLHRTRDELLFDGGSLAVLIGHVLIVQRYSTASQLSTSLLLLFFTMLLRSSAAVSLFKFTTDPAEEEQLASFVAQQFRSTYLPFLYMMAAFVLALVALAFIEPLIASYALVSIASCMLAVMFRIHLDNMKDQQHANLHFGRAMVLLEFVRQLLVQERQAWDSSPALRSHSTQFLASRLLVFIYHAFAGYNALHPSHRLALASSFGTCIWRPGLSQLGKPSEDVLTWLAVLLGMAFGSGTEQALWRGFKREHAERQLRCRAQEQAQAATTRQLATELQAAQVARDARLEQDFLAMTTHEVRNPLNGLVGCLGMAGPLIRRLDGADPDVVRELRAVLDDATLCSDHVLQVLANMTSMQRLEAGLLHPEQQPVLLADVFARTAAVVTPQLAAGVVLRQQLDASAAAAVDADPKMLVQILTNIAQNACRHTKAGFVELRASAAVDVSGPHDSSVSGLLNVELSVRDSGPGLSTESMQTCFDKYSTKGGTGLGLYLTRLQVKQLGGSISVVSPWTAEHSGAMFTVQLQLRPAATLPSNVSPPHAAPPPRFKPGVNVLVADDMRLNRQLLRRAFETEFGANWTVREAATAEEAIALLVGGHGFHLLVMDEVFSDMDVGVMRGSAAIQLLRQREALEGRERLKIVSCTGNSVGESCAHLLEAGADAVWGKPFPNVQDGSMQRRVARLLPDYVV